MKSRPPKIADIRMPQSDKFDSDGSNSIDAIKLYLTFIPHSGFHNQRIALENAIVLSWFLNRTLVMPPSLLGIRRPLHKLENDLSGLRSEPAEIVCKNAKPEYKPSCIQFHNSYTFYPWDSLFNFSIVAEYNVKILPLSDYSDKKIFNILNISDPLNQVYKSFTSHTNHSFYDFETLDAKTLKKNPNKDFESLLALRNNTKKLFYFGSLFGTNRLMLKSSESKKFLNEIRANLMPNNKIMLEVVDKIVDNLGGYLKFISVHARIGDSHFRSNRNQHLTKFINDINKDFPNLSNFQQTSYSNYSCQPQSHFNSSIPNLFVASDVAKNSKLIIPFIKVFPCLYMLSDFYPFLEPYRTLKNPIDNKILYKFLLPLTDLMVAARASNIYSVHASTFGRYLNAYHRFLDRNIVID
nr:10759_t:CDS:2 [Entrophospora candida]